MGVLRFFLVNHVAFGFYVVMQAMIDDIVLARAAENQARKAAAAGKGAGDVDGDDDSDEEEDTINGKNPSYIVGIGNVASNNNGRSKRRANRKARSRQEAVERTLNEVRIASVADLVRMRNVRLFASAAGNSYSSFSAISLVFFLYIDRLLRSQPLPVAVVRPIKRRSTCSCRLD